MADGLFSSDKLPPAEPEFPATVIAVNEPEDIIRKIMI